jgi:hypothetical protein
MRQETVVSGFSARGIARGGLLGAVVGATLALAGPALAAAPAPTLGALQIPEGAVGLPQSVAISPNGQTMYVSGGEFGSEPGPVYVVNLADPTETPQEISASPGGAALADAGSIALSANGEQLYIANLGGSGPPVEIADVGGSGASNNAVVGSISAGTAALSDVASLAVAPNGQTVYMSATGPSGEPFPSGGAEVDAAAMTSPTAGTISATDDAANLGDVTGLTISPNGKLLYAANWAGPATVSKISGIAISTPQTLPEVFSAYNIALSPDGHTLYGDVSNFLNILSLGSASGSASAFAEIDTFALSASGTTASISDSSVLNAGAFPFGMTLNASGTTGYLTDLTVSGSSSTPSVSIDSFPIAAAASKVTVSGSAKTGGTLTAKLKAVSGASASYEWMANGKAIKGATKSKLKLTKSMAGKKLAVKVTVTAVGYHEATVTSKAMKVK